MSGKRLSQVDAFFVAYQNRSGVLMQLGCEVELQGKVSRADLVTALEQVVGRWPELGQHLRVRTLGLAWDGPTRVDQMLHVGTDRREIDSWRNTPIDPFEEPPFQLLWIARADSYVLAFRAHHAVADGESLFVVCREVVSSVALHTGDTGDAESAPPRGFSRFVRPVSVSKLRDMCRQHMRLASEARRPQSLRLPIGAPAPGPIDVVRTSIRRSVPPEGVSTRCLFAAAWMRSLYRFSEERSRGGPERISLEIPVSSRRRLGEERWLGNYIAPLVVEGQATEPLSSLARKIQSQLKFGYRRRLHLSTPWLTSLSRYLPWRLFRRVATLPGSTGFATSHFTCLGSRDDYKADLYEQTRGAVELRELSLWTPVCLEMGVALMILEWPRDTEIFITYRRNAFERGDAERLATLWIQELSVVFPEAARRPA